MPEYGNSIQVLHGYQENAYTYYPVIVVGAGESGIAVGCQLKEQLGFDQFRIFERASGIGGTWWVNRYPGVACDVLVNPSRALKICLVDRPCRPALFYSFSFCPNYRWSSFHPPGREIIQYLQDVCAKYQIVDKIQLNTEVAELRYLKHEELWEVKLQHLVAGSGDLTTKERKYRIDTKGRTSVVLREETIRAKVVCSAAGGLVEPNTWPESIPGIETFEGNIFHSARWDHSVDLSGKNVIVMGTGCSAAQLVPKLPNPPYNAKSVTQLMRSPPWVVPRTQPPFGAEKWARYSPTLFTMLPGLGRAYRTIMFLTIEATFFFLFPNTSRAKKGRKKYEANLLDHMRKSVPEKYYEILTPDYGLGCKRRIFDELWFPSLSNPAIELTTLPLTSIQPNGVTLGPGRTYPDPQDRASKVPTEERKLAADVIVLANGFEAKSWLHPLRIIGKDGRLMSDVWEERGGAQAYMGSTMDGFPNFFIIFGPNTATGHSSVILASENMTRYAIRFIKRILNGDVRTVEVKKKAEMAWTKTMQEKLKDTVWTSNCQSWYIDSKGWNATAYP
ncbi:MAG: hypothetical protein Q9195_002273 [Heterodermia aff. obscurata]